MKWPNVNNLLAILKDNPTDNTAFTQLADVCLRYSGRAINKHKLHDYDSDDLEQLCRIVIWESIKTYNETRGMSFLVYARNRINYSLFDIAKREQARPSVNLDDEDFVHLAGSSNESTPLQIAEIKDEADVISEHLNKLLQPSERQLFDSYYVDGDTAVEIAKRLNITEKSIEFQILKLSRRLKAAGYNPVKGRGKAETQMEHHLECYQMRQSGMKRREIAKALGVSTQKITDWLYDVQRKRRRSNPNSR